MKTDPEKSFSVPERLNEGLCCSSKMASSSQAWEESQTFCGRWYKPCANSFAEHETKWEVDNAANGASDQCSVAFGICLEQREP